MKGRVLKLLSLVFSIIILGTYTVIATPSEGNYRKKSKDEEQEGSGIYFRDLISPYKMKKPPYIENDMNEMDDLLSKTDAMKDSGEWALDELEVNRGDKGKDETNERKGGQSTDPGTRISDDVYKIAKEFGPMVFPAGKNGARCSSTFGSRNVPGGTKNHKGADIAGGQAAAGQPIYAAADGVYAERTMKAFNTITISHKQGVYTRYLHASKVVPYKVGDSVKKGDIIGYIGGMGPKGPRSYGAHLHFEVHVKGINNGVYKDAVNPWIFIDPSAVSHSSGVRYGGLDQPSVKEMKSKRGAYNTIFK